MKKREPKSIMNMNELSVVVENHGGIKTDVYAVFRDVFKVGDHWIQKENMTTKDMKANPIIYMKNDDLERGRYRILFEDTYEKVLSEALDYDFVIWNGLTYFGRRNTLKHASKLFALIFDIDGVDPVRLDDFLSVSENSKAFIYPKPNYIVLSGHGVHLYYLLEEPANLYPEIKRQLKDFKYQMTQLLWNRYTSNYKEPQFQGINQGFRIPNSKTKVLEYRSMVYRFEVNPYSLSWLAQYTTMSAAAVDPERRFKETKYSLHEAEELFPDWYQRRVIDNQPRKGWTCKEDLYRWWLNRIKSEAKFGHRYFCVMALAIYAVKCGISRQELEKDAYDLIPIMNEVSKQNLFTKEDVDSALRCYDADFRTFPIKDIAKITAIPITKNKRNGRSQAKHLAGARAIRDINNENWRLGNGRKNLKKFVQAWRRDNPNGKKADCIRQTGLSKPTVYKWWSDTQ